MAGRYQAKPPRFTIEHWDGSERIRIEARRHWPVLAFLALWLAVWTAGGVAAIVDLRAGRDLFLLIWLAGWALGWLMVAATIAWQLAGSETLCAQGGDLEIGWKIAGLGHRRRYRGAQISGLAPSPQSALSVRIGPVAPPFLGAAIGSLSFRYGARTIRVAAGLDEAEARQVVDHLRMRLPGSATR